MDALGVVFIRRDDSCSLLFLFRFSSSHSAAHSAAVELSLILLLLLLSGVFSWLRIRWVCFH